MVKRTARTAAGAGKKRSRKQDDADDNANFFLLDDDDAKKRQESEEEEEDQETAEQKRIRLGKQGQATTAALSSNHQMLIRVERHVSTLQVPFAARERTSYDEVCMQTSTNTNPASQQTAILLHACCIM